MGAAEGRVVLRDERAGADSRHLSAYLDAEGNLHIEGQDLGPATRPFGRDDEYEWFERIARSDVPALITLLDGAADEHILDVLKRYTGAASYELERRLRDGNVPVRRHVR